MADMTDILHLVRSGRLSEATAEIQRSLGGTDGAADAASAPPTKDVTPRPRALPAPDQGARAAGQRAERQPGAGRKGKRTRPPQRTPWVGKTAPGRRVADPPLPADGAWLSRAGAVPHRLFRPGRPQDAAPLIVMLHGCTQTPEDFAAGTAMCLAADRIGAHVAFPEQIRMANANACWNWFEPAHQGRSGEAAAIVAVIRSILHEIGDERPVHVAGLSAGGAMAAILGAHYPDVVASVGIHSGLPAGSARDVSSAFTAMGSGGVARAPLAVPAIVFHGTADRTVAPSNGAALMPDGLVSESSRVIESASRRTTVLSVRARDRAVASELWQVEGLGHAWSGGDRRGSYVDPAGPDATAEMLRFFAETA